MMPAPSNYKYTPISNPRSVTDQQPKPSSEIYPMDPPKYNEKSDCHEHSASSTHCECESQRNGSHTHSDPGHRCCHNSRLRRLLIPALIVLIVVGGLMTLGCTMGVFNPGSWGSDLVSRAIGDGTGAGNGTNGGTFVHNKLYLIVVFVGLVVVVILGICLSAWCCRGSFENPLCCPCYLCACCGGLACLECIGCGLCAEGLEQM